MAENPRRRRLTSWSQRAQNESARDGRMPQNGGRAVTARAARLSIPIPEVRFNQIDPLRSNSSVSRKPFGEPIS
jgi:hypothetical protein